MEAIPERLAHAVRHHQAGRLREAETLYRCILADTPGEFHVLHLLGVLAHQTGRAQEAVELIRQALTLSGPDPVFASNLSAACLDAGLLDEAADAASAALRLRPDFADARNNLGVALRRQGRLADAEGAFRAAVRFDPRHVDARTNLGATLQQQGDLTEALVQLQEAIRLAPGNAQAHNDLGGTFIAARQPDLALPHLRRAIRLKPDFPEAHNNLGVALRNVNEFEESLECFQTAVRLKPLYVRARINLGHALQLLGRLDDALAEFLEALRLEPKNALALSHLSNLAQHGYYRFPAEQVHALEELAALTDIPPEEHCRIHFALARLRDKAGAYDEAFAHCTRGNELRREYDRRRGLLFDPDAHHAVIDRLIATCTPEYFQQVGSFGNDSELPIFVVGMMRSGTTLAEQILASHPRVHGAGELPDIERLVGGEWSVVSGTQRRPEPLTTPHPPLTTHDSPPTTHHSPYPQCLSSLNAATARTLAEDYLERLRRRGGPAARVVDKMPFNFLHLGFIATLFPRARIIHCRRDAIDTCLSCFFQNFTDVHPFAFDLRHLAQYYREYERLMAHWARVLPVPIFNLQYEELTTDQEAVSRRLLAFCGLEWDDRCLRFHETNRPIRTASALQVRQPMYQTSVGRWKHYQAHLRPLLEVLARDMDQTAGEHTNAKVRAYPATIIVRHPKENPKKCSILPLRGREDLVFLKHPVAEKPDLAGYVRLAADGPELSPADKNSGLLLLDASWRWAESMTRGFLDVPPRSLHGYRTAYPRVSKRGTDPGNGLASVEALFLAYHILGRPTAGLLDHYRWREEFLRLNGLES